MKSNNRVANTINDNQMRSPKLAKGLSAATITNRNMTSKQKKDTTANSIQMHSMNSKDIDFTIDDTVHGKRHQQI